MIKLGVNVDHVATLRQARRVAYPDPVEAALSAIRAGADAITVHLREDRRHIQDDDLVRLRKAIKGHLNQELAPVEEMVNIAERIRPSEVCFVPERRQELTTEGGLDVVGLHDHLKPLIERLKRAGIKISLFVDPESEQIEASASLGVEFVELHTGTYANLADRDLKDLSPQKKRKAPERHFSDDTLEELEKLRAAAKLARSLKLRPNAGHGLNYDNVAPIAAIPGLNWLHIGHSIVARAILVGMARAVREMKQLIELAAASTKRK